MLNIDTSYLIVAQFALDFVLLLGILMLYRRLAALNPRRLEATLKALQSSQQLSLDLERNLEEKRHLVEALQTVLEERARDAGPSRSAGAKGRGVESGKKEVLRLWRDGQDVQKISEATGLGRGEIELIIALAKTIED